MTVTLFGGIAAAARTVPLVFRSDKVRALLAYLIMHRSEPIPRAELAYKLFGDYPDQVGRKNLNLVLTRLRQTLAPVQERMGRLPLLDTDREQIILHWQPTYHWADVVEFADLLGICRLHPHASLAYCVQCQQRLKQMLPLYRGPFLAGLHVKNSPDFNEWRLWQAETCQQQMIEILSMLAENALAAANYPEAITYAQQQINLIPWQELAYRQVITAYIATGQPAAALAQFATLKQVLADKLRAEPGAETMALINHVGMLSDMDLASPPVPTPHNPWLDDLSHLLLDPVNRLVTVIGPTGTELTDLAQALTQRLEKQFPHGVYIISLADCDPSDPETITQTIAAALNLQLSVLSTQPSLLSFLRPRHILLILYPFTPFIQPEAPADGVTLVINILREAPQVTMMVVASRPLQLQQEIVYRL
jgi:DNA-binding SARP family transcriptional activator